MGCRARACEVERVGVARATIRSGRARRISPTSGRPTSVSFTVTVRRSRPSDFEDPPRARADRDDSSRRGFADRRLVSGPLHGHRVAWHERRRSAPALAAAGPPRSSAAARTASASCDPLPERPLHDGDAEQERADGDDRRVRPRPAAEPREREEEREDRRARTAAARAAASARSARSSGSARLSAAKSPYGAPKRRQATHRQRRRRGRGRRAPRG